jgi:hypothetical protein
VIAFTIGKRKAPQAAELLHQVHDRAPDSIPYFTSDELEHYTAAIQNEYGIETPIPKTGRRGRPRKPVKVVPSELVYAQVHKEREKGKVIRIAKQIVFGTEAQVADRLKHSPVSHAINTAFIERNNLTLRQQNGRLHRKTLQFSKEAPLLEAQLHLFLGFYHFIRPHEGLKLRNEAEDNKWHERTPFMAAGITDHVWTFTEFFFFRPNVYKKEEI